MWFMVMIVFTVFQYSVLRSSKDSFVVDIAPEFLSAMKSFVVLPMSAVVMVYYMEMSKRISRVRTYHVFNFLFGGIIVIYGFVINDSYETYFINGLQKYQVAYPSMYYLIGVLRYWVVAVYYLTAELYGTIMLSLLFWQIANQITPTDEASSLYPKLGIAAQLGLFISGQFSSVVSTTEVSGTRLVKPWDVILENVGIASVASTAVLFFSLERLRKIVGDDTINFMRGFKEKAKMTFRESIAFIVKSPEIGFLVLFVLSYGIAFNTIEGVFKKYATMAFVGKTEYFLFNSKIQMWTSGSAVIFGILGSALGSSIS